ncbi:MAG: PKD domain-containing protein, partial [Patescibacteria group bacterium]
MARIVAPSYSVTGSAVRFEGQGSTDNTAVTRYAWQFPNGSTSSDMNETYTFTQDGLRTVTLTVYDAAGNSNTATHTILIVLSAPQILFVTTAQTNLVIIGKTTPFAQVFVYVFSQPRVYQTQADRNGDYQVKVNATELQEGQHYITAIALSPKSVSKTVLAQVNKIVALEISAQTVRPIQTPSPTPQIISTPQPVNITIVQSAAPAWVKFALIGSYLLLGIIITYLLTWTFM